MRVNRLVEEKMFVVAERRSRAATAIARRPWRMRGSARRRLRRVRRPRRIVPRRPRRGRRSS